MDHQLEDNVTERSQKHLNDSLNFNKKEPISKIINDLENKASGDENAMIETKIESENESYYEAYSMEYDYFEEEYKEFLKFLKTNIQTNFHIATDDLKLSMENFKQLIHIYGSREGIEKNLQIQFKPQVFIVKNQNVYESTDYGISDAGHCSTSPKKASEENIKPVNVISEDVYIYPNELTLL